MKIALLNLLYDNNYGGHLQRYALMKVLDGLGNETVHLYCRNEPSSISEKIKGSIRKILFLLTGLLSRHNLMESLCNRYGNKNMAGDMFYKKYIKHTSQITNREDLKKYLDFDVFVVGSDQVWRKRYMLWGMGTYFFDYLPNNKTKIAYSVSLGANIEECTPEEIEQLTPLYNNFKAVSVREDSAIEILHNRGWNKPKPVLTLDPTMLLSRDNYLTIINDNKTRTPKGDLFVYVLDKSDEVKNVISKYNLDEKYKPYSISIKSRNPQSVPQWLRNFRDAKCVITDSFHGLVFSVIFNKPFYLVLNEQRGSARFISLLNQLGLTQNGLDLQQKDWIEVNSRIESLKKQSFYFIKVALQ